MRTHADMRVGTVTINQLEQLAGVFALAQAQVQQTGTWSMRSLRAAFPDLRAGLIREYLESGERQQCLARLHLLHCIGRQTQRSERLASKAGALWEKRRRGEAPLPKGFLRTPDGNIIRERRAGERGGIMSPSGTQAQEAAK